MIGDKLYVTVARIPKFLLAGPATPTLAASAMPAWLSGLLVAGIC
jgi:hypothetical protein